ncbi:hypothetical protein G6F43_012402 [Rhizopus delemar]|nr:hypothetical protein G6F43_012402 [Rhizopus delemar]
MTAIGKKHEVEYHYSTNAWMTTYVKKLNVAFGRKNRKIGLLLDNASIHKIRIPLNNIKLIFLLANTTSNLQALDAGIIANFKAHFRAQQYDRALCLYISKKLNNLDVYKMDQAQAMVFLANAWLKVKPETINGMLPDLPRKFDNKVTDVSQLNLEADESDMIVCYTANTTNNEETAEGNVDETEENDNTEQDEQCVDIVQFPLDDLDRKLHRRIRMRLAGSCAELNKSKEQTDLRSYSCKVKNLLRESGFARIEYSSYMVDVRVLVDHQDDEYEIMCAEDAKGSPSKAKFHHDHCKLLIESKGALDNSPVAVSHIPAVQICGQELYEFGLVHYADHFYVARKTSYAFVPPTIVDLDFCEKICKIFLGLKEEWMSFKHSVEKKLKEERKECNFDSQEANDTQKLKPSPYWYPPCLTQQIPKLNPLPENLI